MATLKVIMGKSPEETKLVIKETGEMVHLVTSVSFYSNIELGVQEIVIKLSSIEMEVDTTVVSKENDDFIS